MTVDVRRLDRYLCVMFRGLVIFLLMVAPVSTWSAQTGQASPNRPAEYMIYQYPNNSLVVKIDAPEVPFSSSIFGPEETLIMSSGVPSARIGPLYQFVPPVDKPRQLMIKISPERSIERATISMELIQLPTSDPNSAVLAQAYRLLSHGTEKNHSNDTTTWAMKAYTLRNAAGSFASFGWEEMRLLSEFYAAHLILHKLNDELLSMEMSEQIQRSARRAGFEWIELAALTLQAEALVSSAGKTVGSIASARFEQLHSVLNQVVILAQRLDLKSEQARALYNDALAFLQQNQREAAIRQLQRALDVSLSVNNPELVNEIRATAATTYESLGSTTNAISMLQDIGTELEGGSGEDVTDNLYEKGRVLNASFHYPEAAQELSQALDLQTSQNTNANAWGPVGLALAWSLYSMGDMEQAVDLTLQAISRTSQNRNPTELVRAYLAVANIFRGQKAFARMKEYREKQGALARSEQDQVEHAFESALDAWQSEGSRSKQARNLLVQARQGAVAAGLVHQGQRASLYLCLLSIEQAGGTPCSRQHVNRTHRALKNSGVPRLSLEADFVVARIHRGEGRDDEAIALMALLIDQTEALQQTLPGVLGAWYWQNRTAIFEEYMALLLDQSNQASGGSIDGERVLLALNRIRTVESSERFLSGEVQVHNREEELRSLIAKLESAKGADAENLALQSTQALDLLSASSGSPAGGLTAASLREVLGRLKPNETILSYYLAESGNFVLVGTQKNVSLLRLRNRSSTLSEDILILRDRIFEGFESPVSQLDTIGRALLGPVADRLTEKIYLLPGGALNGFPFSALRLNGEFLAENHEVTNLVNLSVATRFRVFEPENFGEKVFLAGNPQSDQKLFSYDLQVSPEISMVTNRFVGAGLHVVQGVALRPDEFRDSRLTDSQLIHLAMPGTIDLTNPDRSRLLMSGAGVDSGIEFLYPGGLQGISVGDSLVVLSRTAIRGSSPSSFDSDIGFVTDFMEMGAGAVLASLWVGKDGESMAFLSDFYDQLASGSGVSEALSRTRKKRLKSVDEMNLGLWAGFQLFIR